MPNVHFEMTASEAKAVQAWLAVERAEKRAETGARRQGKATVTAAQRGAGELKNMITQYLTIGAAIGTIRKAWGLWQQDLVQGKQKLVDFQKAFVELQFMGENWKRSVDIRAQIEKFGVRTGIPVTEIAPMETEIASRMAWASPKRRQQTREAIINLAKTADLPAATYVAPLATMQRVYRGLDPGMAANLMAVAAERANVSRAQIAAPLTKALAGGAVGQISAPESTALFNMLTGIAPTAEIAGERLKIMMRQMMTMAPALMKKYGITEGMTGLQRLGRVQATAPGALELKEIMGAEAMAETQILFKEQNWRDLQNELRIMRETTGAGRDILGEKIAHVRMTDPVFRGLEGQARLEQAGGREERRRAAARLEAENIRQYMDYRMRVLDRTPLNRAINLALYDIGRFTWGDPQRGPSWQRGILNEEELHEYLDIIRGLGTAVDKLDAVADKLNQGDVPSGQRGLED